MRTVYYRKEIQSIYLKTFVLDAIIAVGYRVNSKKATRFRQWATKTLKEYITKGFVLNDDMLKNGKLFGKDYFAVTGKTAAELVYERVNAEKPAMGLTTWKDAPDGKILKTAIEEAYSVPGFEMLFWDDVVNDNLDKLDLTVEPVIEGQITEIDTVKELEKMNESR